MGGEMEFRKRDFLRSISSNYTAVDADALLVDTSSGAITITLPEVSLAARVIIKKTDAPGNDVTIVTEDGAKIDGVASLVIASQNEVYSLISDGEDWYTASSMQVTYAEGTSNFAGPGGVTITHNLNLADYVPGVIPSADSSAVGAIWITDVAVNTFIVRNSGSGVSAFTWSIHKS